MVDARAERQAYFASLATPDLIVCATVERASFSGDDLQLIQEELVRRGVDPSRLAQPGGASAGPVWPSATFYSVPLPAISVWWREGWQVFKRYFGFLAALTLVLCIPEFILRNSLGAPHSGSLSFRLIADTFLLIAFRALFAAAVFQSLCRLMNTGHCSIGRAVALGLQRWSWVFVNGFKAAAIAFGIPFVLIVLGYSSGAEGFVALGVILTIFPGIYLALRYVWVQPLAALNPSVRNPLAESKLWMNGLYGRVLGFLVLGILFVAAAALGSAIVSALLPGDFLDSLAHEYITALTEVLFLAAFLVGYLHMLSQQSAGSQLEPSGNGMPLPPAPPI